MNAQHAARLLVALAAALAPPACNGSPAPGGWDEDGSPIADTLDDEPDAVALEDVPSPVDLDENTTVPTAPPIHVVAAGTVALGMRSSSHACVSCHSASAESTALRDASGRDVSPYALWRSSMMANASRDPFYRATLSAERAQHPEHAAAIEAKCLTCHAPLAAFDAQLAGVAVTAADLGTPTPRGLLGADGVTCTACHGLAPSDADDPARWSGAFTFDPQDSIYGPHADPFETPMVNQAGLRPVLGPHVLESAQCMSCHTLMTRALDLPDAPEFPEQTPLLEWLNSDFAAGPGAMSCQGCHLPTRDVDGAPIVTRIARRPQGGDFPPVAARSPFGRHLFVGANTLVPRLLQRARDTLLPSAPDAAFDATIAAARTQLATGTATVRLEDVAWASGRLTASVRIDNLVGHKLPTGYPSRRMWLRVTVTDGSGAIRFVSGRWDDAGRILGGDGLPLASELVGGPVAPHRDRVAGTDDVAIWETVLADGSGAPTIGLMRAVSYLKDNRLLPAGWRADGPWANLTRPVGVAGDPNHGPGHDALTLDLPAPSPGGTLSVALVYQVLGARWAAELFTVGTPDTRALEAMIDEVGLAPELIGVAAAPF